ncbi:DMT family transporter [Draconibacterium halophilum]|uniref:DMT family transporter n=1 Tax=Draconibacterium halophilum TaxID=2706887 RepID=A0A6C0RJK1_9BACT|nr:DMT family transporter [Draconibacterium halophilum]QIA09753.1 DMT family transporter [Draconibacterium halophilum]
MKNKELLAILSALGAIFFWSFSFVWFKIAFIAYKPITVVLFRLLISAFLILIIARFLKRLQKPGKKDYKLFFLIAFFEPFLYFLGESYGLQYVSSTVAAVIVATIPLFTPMAAWYFHKEKLSKMNMVGLVISFAGVALVVLNGSFRLDASPLGIGLEFMAVLSAIGYSIVLKSLASRYNTLTIIAYQNIIGVILFLPIWLTIDFQDFLQTPFHPQAFRAIILLAVFSSTFAFVFFTQSVRQLGVTRSNTFTNLIPVFVAILAFFILKDELGLQKIVGIIVVVSGLFLSQIKKKDTNGRLKAVEVHRK